MKGQQLNWGIMRFSLNIKVNRARPQNSNINTLSIINTSNYFILFHFISLDFCKITSLANRTKKKKKKNDMVDYRRGYFMKRFASQNHN